MKRIELRPHLLATHNTIKLCPMCLRPSLLVPESGDMLRLERSGDLNIVRLGTGRDYECLGCRAVFASPLCVDAADIGEHRSVLEVRVAYRHPISNYCLRRPYHDDDA